MLTYLSSPVDLGVTASRARSMFDLVILATYMHLSTHNTCDFFIPYHPPGTHTDTPASSHGDT